MLIYKYLYNKTVFALLVNGVLWCVLFSYLICIIDLNFPGVLSYNDEYDPINLIKERPTILFSMLFIGPFMETAIQYLPLKVLESASFKINNYAIWISAIVFALLHGWEPVYFLSLFFAGLVWGNICFILIRRKKNSYLIVGTIHALYNLIILTFDYLFF